MSEQLNSKIEFGSKKHPLHPKLELILLELLHHNPALSFVANSTLTRFTGAESSTVVDGVAVFDGYQALGSICASFRDHDATSVYEIVSEHINRKRGIRNQKTTKHLKEAMKIVKDAFRPTPADAVAVKIIDELREKLDSMRARAAIRVDTVVSRASKPILEYLHYAHNNPTASAALPTKLLDTLESDWQTAHNNYRIAAAVREQYTAQYGAAVRIERDGTINVADLMTKQLMPVKSTYELPTNYQEKITMLKIMDEYQPIEHVGARFDMTERTNNVDVNYSLFFLIAGETYTTC